MNSHIQFLKNSCFKDGVPVKSHFIKSNQEYDNIMLENNFFAKPKEEFCLVQQVSPDSFHDCRHRPEVRALSYRHKTGVVGKLKIFVEDSLPASEVVDRVGGHNIEVTHDYLHKPGAIPLPATFSMELGRRISLRGSGMVVRLYSNYPFPWRKDGGAHDDFEQQALEALQAHPQQPYYRFEDYQGRASLRYATADVMHAECISCHNARPDSPKHDWKVGDVRGVLEIIRPLDSVVAQSRTDLRDIFILFGMLLALGLGALTLVITRLRRVSVDLEDQVAQRTTQLAAANQELEAFSYSVSHDLRAPLRSIDGFSRALLDDYGVQLDNVGKDYLQRVRAATQRMGQLIDDMLKLSRVTRSEMNFEIVNLSMLAQTVADELQLAQPERRVEFVCTPGMTVRGDAHLLKVALENLLGNAWKFTSNRASGARCRQRRGVLVRSELRHRLG